MIQDRIEYREDEVKLPSREICLEMLNDPQYKLAEGRKEHVLNVNRIAMKLGESIQKAGENINLDILDRATLLHDIAKGIDKDNHSREGANLVRREGWDEVMAEAIELHASEKAFESSHWETKLLYYIDRRNDGKTGKNMTINDYISMKIEARPEKREFYERLRIKCIQLEKLLNNILNKVDKNLDGFFKE